MLTTNNRDMSEDECLIYLFLVMYDKDRVYVPMSYLNNKWHCLGTLVFLFAYIWVNNCGKEFIIANPLSWIYIFFIKTEGGLFVTKFYQHH